MSSNWMSWPLSGVVALAIAACSSEGKDDEDVMDNLGATGGHAGTPLGGAGATAAGGVFASGGAGFGNGGTTASSGGTPGASGTVGVAGSSGAAGTSSGGGAPGGGGTGASGAAGMAAAGTAGGPPATEGACTPPPSGTFDTTRVMRTGPDGNYTIIRPTTLGEGGFKHPPIAWGNGLSTRPNQYAWLDDIAAHGFVIIANPGTGSNPQVVRQGLEWLIEQNGGSGDYAGMLAPDCAGTIGYSMGGGAAVGSGSHPAVKAIVSIHGLPDNAGAASGPILLTTSEGDNFVTKSGFVEPCYSRSTVQPTILASHQTGSHTEPMRADGGDDLEPAIAWLRYWIYGDQAQREWFFGEDCTLCSWPDFRRKNHPEWD